MRLVSYDMAALIGVVIFCTLWVVLVLQDLGRKAAGQRAETYKLLWEITEKQDRHESLLSLIEHSVKPERHIDTAWMDDLASKAEKPQSSPNTGDSTSGG